MGRGTLIPPSSALVALVVAVQPLNRELILLEVRDTDNAIPVVERPRAQVHLTVLAAPDVRVRDVQVVPDVQALLSDQQNGAQQQ